jgi:hypothetical protein
VSKSLANEERRESEERCEQHAEKQKCKLLSLRALGLPAFMSAYHERENLEAYSYLDI